MPLWGLASDPTRAVTRRSWLFTPAPVIVYPNVDDAGVQKYGAAPTRGKGVARKGCAVNILCRGSVRQIDAGVCAIIILCTSIIFCMYTPR